MRRGKDTKMDFKDRLKELRTQRGYSQSELAKKLHVSKSTVSMLEVGSRQPSLELMEIIADFFNVSMDYLNGKEDVSKYFFNPETAEMAKELYEREELRVLFDASRNASPEDIMTVARMLKGLSKDE